MQKALDDFEACMRRVRALHALYFSFAARLTAAVDLSDILRPEVVLAVSALDYFIHELTRIGMLESWVGTRAQTDALQRYQLPLSIAKGLSNVGTAQQVLDAEIRTKHSFLG